MAKDESLPSGAVPPVIPGARIALTLLILINLFNYIDRQVLAAVEPEIRKELLADVPEDWAKFWMGTLASAFLMTYILIAPVFGFLADRYSRWKLIGFGVVIWSIASGLSGLTWTAWGFSAAVAFSLLFVTRCLVGVGEAAYGPVAPAMIADLFTIKKRGMVLAFLYVALPVGGAIGFAWGEVAVALSTWHWAFFTVVPPGLALGIWAFCMRDPPKGRADAVEVGKRKLSLADIGKLLRIPSYTLNTAGMTCMAFAVGGLAYWMSDFLEQRHVESLGPLGPRTAFGALTALAGLLSTISGGIAGDYFRTRFSGSYFLVSGIAMLIGAPLVLGIVYAPFPLAWVFVFLAVFCLFFNTGPTNTILANVTHPAVRASAFALNILIIHLLGDVISPPLIGLISGAGEIAPASIASSVGMLGSPLAPASFLAADTLVTIGVERHIDRGFILVAIVMAVGGVAWLCGTRVLAEDTRIAPTRL